MSAATVLGIFFVPALFVFIERIGGHKDALHAVGAAEGDAAAPGKAAVVAGPHAHLSGAE